MQLLLCFVLFGPSVARTTDLDIGNDSVGNNGSHHTIRDSLLLAVFRLNDLPTPAPNNMGKLIFPHKLATARAWLQTIWETCPSNPNNMRNRTFHRFHIILEPVESTFAFNQFRTNLDSVWFLIILKSDRSLSHNFGIGWRSLSFSKHFMQYYWIRISESYNFWNQMGGSHSINLKWVQNHFLITLGSV